MTKAVTTCKPSERFTMQTMVFRLHRTTQCTSSTITARLLSTSNRRYQAVKLILTNHYIIKSSNKWHPLPRQKMAQFPSSRTQMRGWSTRCRSLRTCKLWVGRSGTSNRLHHWSIRHRLETSYLFKSSQCAINVARKSPFWRLYSVKYASKQATAQTHVGTKIGDFTWILKNVSL